jgi:hypothetical protein
VRGATPIKSACSASSKPPASVGLDVRPGRKHSDARTISVTNVSDAPRTVRVEDISRLEGACTSEWSRSTALTFVDTKTGAAPQAMTLAPGEHVELAIGPQFAAATWDCVKLGLALKLSVSTGSSDAEHVCADAGAWIAASDGRDDE